ncbi:MAG: hypothetical protein U5L00_13350 [Desulfovermiculus sp.]|nr:hypothetical protein [Desulfovermiculus sp.]
MRYDDRVHWRKHQRSVGAIDCMRRQSLHDPSQRLAARMHRNARM